MRINHSPGTTFAPEPASRVTASAARASIETLQMTNQRQLSAEWLKLSYRSALESLRGPFLFGVPVGGSALFWPCAGTGSEETER